jgi:hypothetical protein
MLTNKMNFLNSRFNSVLLVCYMFRTSYVHLQEEYIVHAALHGMFSMRLCKQSVRLKDVLDVHSVGYHYITGQLIHIIVCSVY